MTFASRTPPAVAVAKAITPSRRTINVFGFRKLSAVIVLPTVRPSSIVIMFISSSLAPFASLSVTPLSLKRLPVMSMPIKGRAFGARSPVIMMVAMGKIIRVVLLTVLSCFILILRSS